MFNLKEKIRMAKIKRRKNKVYRDICVAYGHYTPQKLKKCLCGERTIK